MRASQAVSVGNKGINKTTMNSRGRKQNQNCLFETLLLPRAVRINDVGGISAQRDIREKWVNLVANSLASNLQNKLYSDDCQTFFFFFFAIVNDCVTHK